MIDLKASICIEQAVCHELSNIVKKYGPTYASEYEGFAVLMEECQEVAEDDKLIQESLEEIWKSIRKNKLNISEIGKLGTYAKLLAGEAVQVAAVCERFMETVKK